MKNNKEQLIVQAIKDVLWMARRYAHMRQTYATSMFNDAYDILRDEFGEDIESPSEEKHEFTDFPYVTDGGGVMFNRDLKTRKYAKK